MRVWTSLGIGVTALCFQTMILYPWHHELSGEIQELKAIVEKQNKIIDNMLKPGK